MSYSFLAAMRITSNATKKAMNSQMSYCVMFQPPMLNTVWGSKCAGQALGLSYKCA